jgi:hypothetical protein
MLSGSSGDIDRSRMGARSRASDGVSRISAAATLCSGTTLDSRSSACPGAWPERRLDHHQMAAIATTPTPASIQRNSANSRSFAYIAAMRTASSTSTATRRETPGSFCVTPTSCEAISMVVLL